MSDGQFILLLLVGSTLIYILILATPVAILWKVVEFNYLLYKIVVITTIPIMLFVVLRTYFRVCGWIIDGLGGKRLERILEEDKIPEKLEKVKINRKVPVVLLFITFGILAYVDLHFCIGAISLILFHEVGHFVVAKYYRMSPKFTFSGPNPAVRLDRSKGTKWSNSYVDISGLLFSMLIFPILFLVNFPIDTFQCCLWVVFFVVVKICTIYGYVGGVRNEV